MNFFNFNFVDFFFIVTQSIAEFLPISSTAHLMLYGKIFSPNINSSNVIELLHVFCSFAIFTFYWKEIFIFIKIGLKLFFHSFKEIFIKMFSFSLIQKNDSTSKNLIENFELVSGVNNKKIYEFGEIAVISFPVILGIIILEIFKISVFKFKTLYFVGIFSVIFGSLLFFVDKFSAEEFDELNFTKSFLVGILPLIALFPGVSRLGIIFTALRFFKVKREKALFLSFMCEIPLLIGMLLKLFFIEKFFKVNSFDNKFFFFFFIISLIFGIFSLKFITKFNKKNGLAFFGLYRIVFGIFSLIIFYKNK